MNSSIINCTVKIGSDKFIFNDRDMTIGNNGSYLRNTLEINGTVLNLKIQYWSCDNFRGCIGFDI